MSCTFKIKEAKSSLTSTEQKIGDFILLHKEETIHASAQELAERTKTSAAAIVRFAKKIGYKGFTALKVDLAKDNDDIEQSFDTLILEEDAVETLIKKAQRTNYQIADQTYKLINPSNLEHAIQALLGAKNIYLFGVGGSGIVCNDLQHKLTRINRNVIYHEDTHILMARTALIDCDDVSLAISYSGETNEINTAMKYAKSMGATTIAITQFNHKSTLSKLVDIVLHIPIEEKELRLGAITSRNSSFVLTDLLYLGIAKSNLRVTKESLVKTRNLIQEIK